MSVKSYVTLTTKSNKHPPMLIRFYYIYSSLNLHIPTTLLSVFFCYINSLTGRAQLYIVISIIGD